MTLKTRKPTGKAPWPRVLLSGEEGARKSWTAAELSADDRIGGMYWLEIGAGESTADEYGAIPSVKYTIIDHDGTWLDIYTQLCDAWDEAKAAADRGDLPIAITADSMTGVWSMLCDFVDQRARRREAGRLSRAGKNPADAYSPEAEITISPDLWNLANRRHRQFMAKILTWPGPSIVIAREKQVTAFDEKGSPDPKKPKEWTLEAQKGLGFDCSAWVRMTREEHPEVVKLRSVRNGIQPGADKSRKRPDFSVARLVFEWVGCESGVSRAPEVRTLDADQVMPEEMPPATVQQEAKSEETPAPERPRAVRGPSAQELAGLADKDVTSWLTVDTKPAVTELWKKGKESPCAGMDVSGLLTEEDREILGVREGESLTLVDLAKMAGQYVVKFGRAVRAPLDEPVSAVA